jgi:hypothetical protein
MELLSSFIQLNIKHTFGRDEMEQQGQLLAQAVQDKASEEANKKLAMGTFKDKIDKLSADIKVFSGHVANGFTYRDEPCELYLDYETNLRVYTRKSDGVQVKTESFHASDYQKKIDFENLDEEIEARNEIGEYANKIGIEQQESYDALDKVIGDKKTKKSNFVIKPVPKDNLDKNYGKNFEQEEDGLHRDRHGNLTD